uniref:Transposase n=1 Tax=Elaeophora elaphi TaxID=1147741 RepID=A0A0R3RQ21_9BILA
MCLMRRQIYASVKQIISGTLHQKTMWRERPRLVHQRVRRLLPNPRSRIYWQCLCNALREFLAAKR